MKVEQLKAELVVFKGLMSNVSSACLPLSLRDAQVLGCSSPPLPVLPRCCSFSRQALGLLAEEAAQPHR